LTALVTWHAPDILRADPPLVTAERVMLESWLDWQRETLLSKCAGLTGEQLARRSVPPSDLSLLGLVRHLADAERAWFRRCVNSEDVPEVYRRVERPDAAFVEANSEDAPADLGRLVEEWETCRAAAARASLDDVFTHRVFGSISLRCIYIHMIEEYARHNGHADLLRECIDGVTGE